MKAKALAAVVAPIIAVGTPFLWPRFLDLRTSWLDTTPVSQREKAAAQLAVALPGGEKTIILTDLHTAVEKGVVTAEFRGNGKDWVRARLNNASPSLVKAQVQIGQMFEAGLNGMVVIRPASFELEPGASSDVIIECAATRTANRIAEQTYRLSFGRLPKVEEFLVYVSSRSELSNQAIQTGVLALTENLPLSAVCKFPTTAGEIKSRFNTDAFRVDTFEIIAALTALRAAGVPDRSVVMTVDPQLKIEAMIDPLCRALAMHYYGIKPENEWHYWRKELLEGDVSTRHYALYGIARFYPDTALEMLPRWARETRTSAVFRLAAVQALAETQRPAALPLLRQLAADLGERSELGRAAAGAADHLEARLAEALSKPANVSFRGGVNLSQTGQ
jgi:hypothetical protein